jgi:hypothetical protein
MQIHDKLQTNLNSVLIRSPPSITFFREPPDLLLQPLFGTQLNGACAHKVRPFPVHSVGPAPADMFVAAPLALLPTVLIEECAHFVLASCTTILLAIRTIFKAN